MNFLRLMIRRIIKYDYMLIVQICTELVEKVSKYLCMIFFSIQNYSVNALIKKFNNGVYFEVINISFDVARLSSFYPTKILWRLGCKSKLIHVDDRVSTILSSSIIATLVSIFVFISGFEKFLWAVLMRLYINFSFNFSA